MKKDSLNYRGLTIEDYDRLFILWNKLEETKRALNPVDDSREGIARYIKRNPTTCFGAFIGENMVDSILTCHDGRRAIIHHLCVHPDFQRRGIARNLVLRAEEAVKKEGIEKIFGLVFKDNDKANVFWEKMGYNIRTNLNYRNKSLNEAIPQGE
ncbi:MAG: GNAT family N-acetyltransferase [Treponema sp.]|nr:GNAT family N-acetyltransferase [Treponema sp.]